MAEQRYEPHTIERKWQDVWERERAFVTAPRLSTALRVVRSLFER